MHSFVTCRSNTICRGNLDHRVFNNSENHCLVPLIRALVTPPRKFQFNAWLVVNCTLHVRHQNAIQLRDLWCVVVVMNCEIDQVKGLLHTVYEYMQYVTCLQGADGNILTLPHLV